MISMMELVKEVRGRRWKLPLCVPLTSKGYTKRFNTTPNSPSFEL